MIVSDIFIGGVDNDVLWRLVNHMVGKFLRPILLLFCLVIFFISPESAFNENNVFNEFKFLSVLGFVLIIVSYLLDSKELS